LIVRELLEEGAFRVESDARLSQWICRSVLACGMMEPASAARTLWGIRHGTGRCGTIMNGCLL
jgi:hypothetical protein